MFKQELNDLPDSISELQDMVTELHQEIEFLKDENAFIREELRLQRLKMFTRISERFQDETDNLQRFLFEDLSKDVEEPEKEEDTVINEHKRKKPGRKRIPPKTFPEWKWSMTLPKQINSVPVVVRKAVLV